MGKQARRDKKIKAREKRVKDKVKKKRNLSRENRSLQREIDRMKYKNRERIEPIKNDT